MNSSQKEDLFQGKIQIIKEKLNTNLELTPAAVYKVVIDELSTIPYFHWTGIYLLDEEANELVLDYFKGKPTEHTHIAVGKGVCGSAVSDQEDKIIIDVTKESNYLACSLETRSEIVVLIEDNDSIVGQIDVDSDDIGAFDEIDHLYLRKISKLIVKSPKN